MANEDCVYRQDVMFVCLCGHTLADHTDGLQCSLCSCDEYDEDLPEREDMT